MARYEFPTSSGQRWMWLLAQMDPGEPTYNIAWAPLLDGPLEVSALRQAWDAALVRHEALRTTFRNESGVPVQVIDDEPVTQPLHVTSVEHLPAAERESAALALIGDLARAPFDLATGPLVRVALVRLSPEAHALAVVMHHIVADGWSFRMLFDELSADYEAISRGGDPVTNEPPIQYADFAIWQIEHAEDGGYASAERFWLAELAGAPVALPLPADAPYPACQTFAAGGIDAAIDGQLAGALRQLAARHGTTLFAVLLAAYALVLARLTGSDDMLVAVPMAARTRPETESVVGLFMNTVPIRIRIDRDGTLSDLVRSVHAATARALAHQELPFARVVELVRPDRDPARMPLVQVTFAMEEPWVVPDRGRLRWRPQPLETGTAKFEIALTVTDAQSGPQVRVSYNSDLFQPATGQLVADGFREILHCLADHPDRVVADADIMPPGESALVTSVRPDAGPVDDPATRVGARASPAVRPGSDRSPGRLPQDDTERRLAAAFADILGLARVDAERSFFDLGGHSLSAIVLVDRVRREFGVEMPVRTVFTHPSVAALARLLHGGEETADTAAQMLSATLDSDICFTAAQPAADSVLLTGATGFFGGYLLADLLAATDARIYCVVRAVTVTAARRRITDRLRHCGWLDPLPGHRVEPILGDISEPSLGLTGPEFRRLAGQVGVIYHCAADTHGLKSYQQLAPANVGGTHELLRLAAAGTSVRFQHVSTASVAPASPDGMRDEESWITGQRRVRQTDDVTTAADGYAQTKWVAERLVRMASERGLAAAVYRPAQLTGDRTGRYPANDGLVRDLRGVIEAGVAPDTPSTDLWTPVDHAARTLVAISQRPANLGQVFHLPAALVSWHRVWSILTARGYRLRPVDAPEWHRQISAAGPANPAYPLLSPTSAGSRWLARRRPLDCTNGLAAIRAEWLDPPEVGDELIGRYVADLASRGLI